MVCEGKPDCAEYTDCSGLRGHGLFGIIPLEVNNDSSV